MEAGEQQVGRSNDQLLKKLKELSGRSGGRPLRSSLWLGAEEEDNVPGSGDATSTELHQERVLNYIGQLQILEGLQARLRNEGYSEE